MQIYILSWSSLPIVCLFVTLSFGASHFQKSWKLTQYAFLADETN